ncbi:MAG: UbiD family decarboxylase [Candidatus Binatia bacterium]
MIDLRSFIRRLEEEGELKRVKAPVELKYEIGAICFKELQQGINNNKALLFEQVRGSFMPLATNLLASPKRYLMALDLASRQEWHRFWVEKTSHPVTPILVETAPCQEVTMAQVNLSEFPIPLWNEKDGGHYITMPCVISKDPETKQRNCGIYRMMVHEDWRSTGILAAPYHHIARHLAKSLTRGGALPVAVAIGVSPAITIAAAADFPYGVDEMAMAGALQGEPVEMTRCTTVPLEVPAHAELVLEGRIVSREEKEEGPFGEFTGYYASERCKRPVFKIDCITHRRDPLAVGTYVGRPPQENAFLNSQTTEAEMIRQCPFPGIKDLYVNPLGVLNAVVSVRNGSDGYAKKMGIAMLATEAGRRIKNLIMVDEDIDPRDSDQVSWALAYRVQPERDVEIIKNVTGVVVDPSMPEEERLSGTNRISKMLIDATRPENGSFAEECLPKRELMERVEVEWKKYAVE